MISDSITQVRGFKVAGVHAGLKQDGALDFGLIVSDGPCVTAGVFTTNVVKAAPVHLCMERLKTHSDKIRAVVINTGSANAMTGGQGMYDAVAVTQLTADKLGVDKQQVLSLSTGVIGELLNMEKIADGIDNTAANLGDDWHSTASAIMTTDTTPKVCEITVNRGDGTYYTIAGIAKGSGMIAPNMATMLAVIVTDAKLIAGQAQEALKMANSVSFNRIVVDGDMSTNDTALLMANGASDITIESGIDFAQFQMALIQVCRRLAQAIVRDGEGASKFISININGAPSDEAAQQIANTIATSPLVKTAFYGNDANWGRIIAAAGRAGVPLDVDKLRLYIAPGTDAHDESDELLLVDDGAPAAYDEADAMKIMQSPEITLNLELGMGSGWALVWTSDLSVDYVNINAAYRT
jgi:glutamate N-acetyltransferase / amino-acid N-acetyltransferase